MDGLSRRSDFIHFFKNPLVFGLMSGTGVIITIILAATAGKGSFQEGISMYLSNGILTYLVPASVAVQMGLFRHHRNMAKGMPIPRLEKIGVSGSVIPSAAMIACCVCCAYPVAGILPAMGFLLAASSFATGYSEAIIIAGLLANVVLSIIIYRAILHNKRGKQLKVYSQLVQYK